MIEYLYLGRVPYGESLRLQSELIDLRLKGKIDNILLLLEHPPVLTLGRNANRANVLASDELLAARGVTLYEINRGGDVTYHGPGQLIGYPIFDLRSLRHPTIGTRLGPVDFVRLMEEALIRLCGLYGVPAFRICGLTGVWCAAAHSSPSVESCERKASDPPSGESKIGAIGIHVSRGITSHGFAFNLTTNLRDFQLINPCGITDRPVTTLKNEILARSASQEREIPSLESLAHQTAHQFSLVFNQQILAVESLEALRAQAATPADREPAFPAEDTPLQVPAEIRRLVNSSESSEPPVRA